VHVPVNVWQASGERATAAPATFKFTATSRPDEETRANVKLHAYEVCAESLCKRDMTRKHVGPHVR